MTARNAVALSAVAVAIILAIAPLLALPAWATIILGIFLVLEVAALWMMARGTR